MTTYKNFPTLLVIAWKCTTREFPLKLKRNNLIWQANAF